MTLTNTETASTRAARNKRKPHSPRALSLGSATRFSKTTLEELRAFNKLAYPEDIQRPRTRGECHDGVRPCPFVSCQYNLYLDTSETTGNIKLNFPDLEPHEMAVSCAMDIADQGGLTLEKVAEYMNLTRERARQIEKMILHDIKTMMRALRDSDAPEYDPIIGAYDDDSTTEESVHDPD